MNCSWCSKPLPPIEGRGRPRKYCSDPCREKGRLFVEKQRLVAIAIVDAGPRISYCLYCHAEIRNKNFGHVRMYCNTAHKSRYYRNGSAQRVAGPETKEETLAFARAIEETV